MIFLLKSTKSVIFRLTRFVDKSRRQGNANSDDKVLYGGQEWNRQQFLIWCCRANSGSLSYNVILCSPNHIKARCKYFTFVSVASVSAIWPYLVGTKITVHIYRERIERTLIDFNEFVQNSCSKDQISNVRALCC
jgi:hypothetical protein